MSAKKFYSLETVEREADLVIFGDITSLPWFESDVSSYNLEQEIAALDVDRINVHINSYGGEVAEALAITNVLARHPAQVVTYVDGFACSAATVIFMAGERRIMSPFSNFLVHPAWTWTQGNAEELRKEAANLDAITEQSVNAYMTGITKTRDELVELMAEERFLTPEETLEWGFATEIEDVDAAEARPAASVRQMVAEKLRAREPDAGEFDAEGLVDRLIDGVLARLEPIRAPEPAGPEEKATESAMSRFFNAF